MRAHRRTGPLTHVLVAGVAADLPQVQQLLSELPADAYGQVWLEGDVELAWRALQMPRPGRVTVQTLAPGDVPGRRAALALQACQAEWMPEQECPSRAFIAWVGTSVRSQLVDAVGPR